MSFGRSAPSCSRGPDQGQLRRRCRAATRPRKKYRSWSSPARSGRSRSSAEDPRGVLMWVRRAPARPAGPRDRRRGQVPSSRFPVSDFVEISGRWRHRVRACSSRPRSTRHASLPSTRSTRWPHRDRAGGGHDEREQTLTRCWSRWTVRGGEGVIVIAAPTGPTCSTRRCCAGPLDRR